jgi:hypothetical protein
VESNFKLAHITISMLILHREDTRQKIQQAMQKVGHEIKAMLQKTFITFKKVSFFNKVNPKTKKREVTLLYLEILKDENYKKIERATDLFIREMLKTDIINAAELKQMRIRYDHNENQYKNEENHLTLFRVRNVVEDEKFLHLFEEINKIDQYEPF